MSFRFPGWGIGWFTPLLVLATPANVYSSYLDGSSFFVVFWSLIGLFAVLTWFQQRWVAVPLVLYFLLAALGGSMYLSQRGIQLVALSKVLYDCYAIVALVIWSRSRSSVTHASEPLAE